MMFQPELNGTIKLKLFSGTKFELTCGTGKIKTCGSSWELN